MVTSKQAAAGGGIFGAGVVVGYLLGPKGGPGVGGGAGSIVLAASSLNIVRGQPVSFSVMVKDVNGYPVTITNVYGNVRIYVDGADSNAILDASGSTGPIYMGPGVHSVYAGHPWVASTTPPFPLETQSNTLTVIVN